jgi:hypothetical protein
MIHRVRSKQRFAAGTPSWSIEVLVPGLDVRSCSVLTMTEIGCLWLEILVIERNR